MALQASWSDSTFYMFRDRFEEFQDEREKCHVRRETALNFLAHEDVALKAYFESRSRYLNGVRADAAFNQIGEVLPTILFGGMVVGTWAWERKAKRASWQVIPGRLPTEVRRQVVAGIKGLSDGLQAGYVDSCRPSA
jgi:hypothetical protein